MIRKGCFMYRGNAEMYSFDISGILSFNGFFMRLYFCCNTLTLTL